MKTVKFLSQMLTCAGLTMAQPLIAQNLPSEKLGILLSSHGDIDNVDTELEDYIKISFKKNVGIPLPFWSRDFLVSGAYALSVKQVAAQYKIIGPTRYHSNAQLQAQAIEEALDAMDVDAKVYLGYNFSRPLIGTVLKRMQDDGITKFVVVNKGAQFSYSSSGENMEDVLSYLNKNKDYDAEVLGIRQYSDDPRFLQAWQDAIVADAKRFYPGVPASEICLLIGTHGLPQWLIDKGDPAVDQMVEAVDYLRGELTEYPIYHGYLNDDFIPGAAWVSPDAEAIAEVMKEDGCKNVLMDGRLSFTTHHRATYYDLNYVVRNFFEKPGRLANGQLDPNWEKPKVVLAPNFDADQNFARFIAELSVEALDGLAPTVILKEKGQPAAKSESVGKPGVDPFFVGKP